MKASGIVLRLMVDQDRITVGPSVQEKQWLPALIFQTRALDRLGFEDKVEKVLTSMVKNIDSNGSVEGLSLIHI